MTKRLCKNCKKDISNRGNVAVYCFECAVVIRRETMRAYKQRPEVKAKQKAYHQRPEVKARQKAYKQRPDVKKRQRERRRITRGFGKHAMELACEKLNQKGDLDFMSVEGRKAFVLDGVVLDRELQKRGLTSNKRGVE